MADLKARNKISRDLFPIPENVAPDGTRCIVLHIPDDEEHYAIFAGAVSLLTKWNSWQKDGTTNAVDASNAWKAAIDMGFSDCCENAETRQVDGHEEYSPDGTNWYDYPGAMENPNFNNPAPYPEGSVPEGQTAECLAAENIVTVYKEFAQKTIDVIDALAGWVSLVAVIVTVLATVMSGGFVTAGAVAIAAAILRLTDTWVNHGLDDDVVQTLRCALNCNADSTGKFDPTSFDAVRTKVTAGAPVLAPIINTWLGGYGPVGLNRLANAKINVEADCSECDCSGDHVYDFHVNNGGWFANPVCDIEEFGNWNTTHGWNDNDVDCEGTWYSGVDISIDFGETVHLTHVKVEYTVVPPSNTGTDGSGHVRLVSGGSDIGNNSAPQSGSVVLEFDCDETTSTLNFACNDGTGRVGGAANGELYVYKITLHY